MTEATKACLHMKADFRYGYLAGPVCSGCHKRLRIIAYGCCDEEGRGKLKPECRDHWCGNNNSCPATFDLTVPAESAAPEAEKAVILCKKCGEPEGLSHEFGFRDHAFVPALSSGRMTDLFSVDRAAQEKPWPLWWKCEAKHRSPVKDCPHCPMSGQQGSEEPKIGGSGPREAEWEIDRLHKLCADLRAQLAEKEKEIAELKKDNEFNKADADSWRRWHKDMKAAGRIK